MSDTQKHYSSFTAIVNEIKHASESMSEEVMFVGIDGFSGSGKSLLAHSIENCLKDATIVHIDDFGDWSLDLTWRSSIFHDQVIERLRSGNPVRYRRYFWNTGQRGDWFEVLPASLVIIEGVSALRKDLRDALTIKIWVECSRGLRLQRLLKRDGQAMRSKLVREWMPGEDDYFRLHLPESSADFLFDGAAGHHS